MLKTATLTIVIGGVSALFALNADALPLASAKQQLDTTPILTLVRDDDDDDDQPRARAVEEDDDDEGQQANPLGMILNGVFNGGNHNQGSNHRRHQGNKQHKRNRVQQQPGADGQED